MSNTPNTMCSSIQETSQYLEGPSQSLHILYMIKIIKIHEYMKKNIIQIK